MNKLVIQMNEPDGFNPVTDSTMALVFEAQARDYDVFYYAPPQIAAVNSEIIAQVRPITFFNRTDDFFEHGELQPMNLEEADVILIRQNPPYNMEYLGCTWLLERLQHPKILNNPTAIRNRPEKIFPLEFPELIPPTCISSDKTTLTAFREEHKDVVLKPLYGFGGQAIHHITPESNGFDALVDKMVAEPIILQPYLPEVMTEEKRILLVNGKMAAAYNRLPPEGDFRTNAAVGGSAEKTTLTARQIEIAETVGDVCAKEGLMLIGLDVIGDFLIEINTTCPTGIRAVQQLYDQNIAKTFWNEVEKC
ncbi:MAG: glutathione synthase [Rickettsiales bacterium]|nr:glutathione synthase [Rickettsiales bacterium]